MKSWVLYFLVIAFLPLNSVGYADENPPKGFEDPKLLAKVMAGDIVTQVTVDTNVEYWAFVRAFFNRVSQEAYIALATDHVRYPQLFPEIENAVTTSANQNKTVFDYRMTVLLEYGPFTFKVYPEGRQTVTLPHDPKSESNIVNEMLNYKDVLEFASETTRLIPYQTGILVEDNVHIKAKNAQSPAQTAMVKKQLLKIMTRFIVTFRKELQGDY